MKNIFFDNWDGIMRVIVTTIFAYSAVVVFLRFSGKRTLAKMNAFDFVVTIALGSILGGVILNKNIPIAEGLTAIALLIGLQFLLTSLSVRSKKFKKMISSSPTLLYYKQQQLDQILKKERITIDEFHKAVREAGFTNYEQIFAVVLETTGDITVIAKDNASNSSDIMCDIQNFDSI